MSWKQHRRSNLSVQSIISIIESEGLNPLKCLEGTGMTAASILHIDTEISDETEIKILTKALDLLPDRAGYGILAGQTLRATTFGIWGLVIMTAPTIRHSLEAVIRFSEMSVLQSKMRMQQKDGKTCIFLDMQHLPKKVHHFLFERFIATCINFLKEMSPELSLDSWTLSLPSHDKEYITQLKQLTKMEIYTDQIGFALTCPDAFLDRPLEHTNSMMHAHFVQQCEQMLHSHQILPNNAQCVREYMIQESNFRPKLDAVAKANGMSGRTLRRRLEKDKVKFSEIVLDTKMTLAKEIISTTNMPIASVAFRFGYSEASSFARAYTKWWGQSPTKARG